MTDNQTILSFELSREFYEQFNAWIQEEKGELIRDSLESANPADIGLLLDEFNTEECIYVMNLLEPKKRAEIIIMTDSDERTRFLTNYTPQEIAQLIGYLDSDDAADLLNEQQLKFREEIISFIDDEERAANITNLLRYDEDCAGGLMATELIKANVNWTVKQTIEEIRRQAEEVNKIYSVYVVDNREKLLGRVSLKTIILSSDNVRIADIYSDEIISVETFMSEREVAKIMERYDLDAVPVINVQGKLLGRITIDDIVDVIREVAEEERQLMAGITEDVEENDSVLMLTRARLPWLIIGMAGGLLGAIFISNFEKDLMLIPAMAFFIPLITATGGNVGIQSSSIVVQTLANKPAVDRGFWKRIVKVLLVAILNGVVLAGLVFTFNILLGDSDRLAFVVSIALFAVVLLASFMGTVTPIVLDRFGINPALASGPFITTANDLLGLGVYFGIAHVLYIG